MPKAQKSFQQVLAEAIRDVEYYVGYIHPRFGVLPRPERLVALTCPSCLTRFKVPAESEEELRFPI